MKNLRLLEKVCAKLSPEDARNLTEQVDALAADLPNLESQEFAPTQDHYGCYLSLATDLQAVLALMCAGGNTKGICAAAKINGVRGLPFPYDN